MPGIWWLQWSVHCPVGFSYSTTAPEHSRGVELKRWKWSSLIVTILDGLARVHEHVERLVLDLDQLGGVARELAGRRADGRDRLAHEPHLADRERVVLDLVPGRGRHLEERIGLDRHLVARERSVDAVQRERAGDVDRDDLGVRVRRADEVHVVEEDPLALDEALVLLARDRLADVALLELGWLGGRLGRAHAFALTIASTMFW